MLLGLGQHSVIVNPLSAITISPGNKCSKNPHAVLCKELVRCAASPSFRYKAYASLRGNSYKNFYSVVVLVRQKGLSPG